MDEILIVNYLNDQLNIYQTKMFNISRLQLLFINVN